MPLIVALVVYGGAFFGYAGTDSTHTRMVKANQIQQEWLAQKRGNIEKVRLETLRIGSISRTI